MTYEGITDDHNPLKKYHAFHADPYIGEFIQYLRIHEGMDQELLSIQSGVDIEELRRVEDNKELPSLQFLFQICHPLRIDFTVLLQKMGYVKPRVEYEKNDIAQRILREPLNHVFGKTEESRRVMTAYECVRFLKMLDVMFPEYSKVKIEYLLPEVDNETP